MYTKEQHIDLGTCQRHWQSTFLAVFQLHDGELRQMTIAKCPMPRPCTTTSTVFQCLNLDKGLEDRTLIWGASKSSKSTEHCLQALPRDQGIQSTQQAAQE